MVRNVWSPKLRAAAIALPKNDINKAGILAYAKAAFSHAFAASLRPCF